MFATFLLQEEMALTMLAWTSFLAVWIIVAVQTRDAAPRDKTKSRR